MSERISITERCKGRWPAVLTALGVPGELLDGKHKPCPFCGGKDRFRFTPAGGGSWYCAQCGHGSGMDFLMRFRKCEFRDAAREIEAVLPGCKDFKPMPEIDPAVTRGAMERMWGQGEPVTGAGPVGLYLRSRAIVLDEYPSVLRFLPRTNAAAQGETPVWCGAMLAKVVSDGRAVNVHRTFLSLEASTKRKLMRGTLPAGSAVQLFPIGKTLGIAEGLENALAANMLTGFPVWAALNAGNLAKWQPPPGVERVLIFGDNDALGTGQAAAWAAANRILLKGIAVDVRIPEREGDDWNSVLMRRECNLIQPYNGKVGT